MEKRNGKIKCIICRYKKEICFFTSELDSYFQENEFKRRKNSLVYMRKTGASSQKIEMTFFSHPSYHRDALAHIYPHMEIYFPNINRTAEQFAGNLIPEKWIHTFTIRQPVQIYSQSEEFYFKDRDDHAYLKQAIINFFRKNTMPLLDNLKDERDYLKRFEKKDPRIIWDNNQYLYVTSAYINEQKFEKARQVMENRFGKPGLRRQYADAFSFVENSCKQKIPSL